MKKLLFLRSAVILLGVGLMLGCASLDSRRSVETASDAVELRRLEIALDEIVAEILASSTFARQRVTPLTMLSSVGNQTGEPVDEQAMDGHIRAALIHSGRVQLVNERRRQALLGQYEEHEELPDELLISLGQQLGARYWIGGTLSRTSGEPPFRIEVRVTDLTAGTAILSVRRDVDILFEE